MLDPQRLAAKMGKYVPLLAYDMRAQRQFLLDAWQRMLAGGGNQSLAERNCIVSTREPYTVIAVDGSQIYPDRHEGIDAYLINIGTVILAYGECSSAILKSEPYLFSAIDEIGCEVMPERVNSQRTGYEFEHAVHAAREVHARGITPLVLFDGSLIFWHLVGASSESRAELVKMYTDFYLVLTELGIPYAGYISAPHSKELIALLGDFHQLTPTSELRRFFDADIMSTWLCPGECSGLVAHRGELMAEYPALVKVWGMYLHTGTEIARIELPAWLACNEALTTLVLQQIADQIHKGGGYPIALAEAHEQAVVKGPDRQLFFDMLVRQTGQRGWSTKLLHKRIARV